LAVQNRADAAAGGVAGRLARKPVDRGNEMVSGNGMLQCAHQPAAWR